VYGPAVRIENVQIEAWDVELTEPFGIATGAQLLAQNVLLELELTSGVFGLGES
jgi:L-Ala-D/L-Glu epimerase